MSVVSLIHFNGADASTSIYDEIGRVWTPQGGAQLDTAQKQFGTASLLLDGTGDYLSTPNSTDYDFGTGNWTIECWVRRSGTVGFAGVISSSTSGGTGWGISLDQYGVGLRFFWNAIEKIAGGTIPDLTWTHTAVVRNGNTVTCYVAGQSVGTWDATGGTINDNDAGLVLGRLATNYDGYYFNGHIDETRISKGTAVYTANFTPPTAEFTTWLNKKQITIDETKCGTVDSTNFPMFFGGTYDGTGDEPDLRGTANGGDVANASGYDIAFFSDSNCTEKLDFERVIWTTASGVVEFHVEVPTLDADADTVIYMAYGNTDITADIQNKTGVWTSDYEGVYHFGNGSSLDITSSTGANSGTSSGTPTAVAGINGGGGAAFASGAYISLGAGIFATDHAEISVSGWMKTSTQQTSDIVGKWSGDASRQSFTPILIPGDTILAAVNGAGGADNLTYGSKDMIDGTWHFFAISAKTGADNFKLYQDTTIDVSTTFGTFDIDGNAGVAMIANSEVPRPYTGTLDEVRISTSAKTPSWWTAEYNNQYSPSTFYTIEDIPTPPVTGGNTITRMLMGVGL